jgi:hypothetical protein
MKPIHFATLLGLAAGLSTLWTPAVAPAATITVNPGDSIQAAVDAAAPGDTVKVMPGDYTEPAASGPAVRITKSLKLLAKSKLKDNIRVRILMGPGRTDGIVVEPANRAIPTSSASRSKASPSRLPEQRHLAEARAKFTIRATSRSTTSRTASGRPCRERQREEERCLQRAGQCAVGQASENIRVMQNEALRRPDGPEVTISGHQGYEERHPRQYRRRRPVPPQRGGAHTLLLTNGGDWVFRATDSRQQPAEHRYVGAGGRAAPGLGVLVGVDH